MDTNKFGVAKDDKEMESKSDNEGGLNGDNSKIKRKRRSKNEQEGRAYKCTHCGKSYLSQPALTNHNKTKHFQNDPEYIKRGRGRPRKNPSFNNQPEKDVQKFKLFFLKENRRRGVGDNLDFLELVRGAFQDLYNNFKGRIFQKISAPEEHPLLKEIELQLINPNVEKNYCDQILSSYIHEFFSATNRDYFIFIVKFVTLFRECINHFRTSNDSNLDFSQTNSADGVPDLCNEFITEFMESNDNFGLDVTEIIEIIQHFCNWLYESKYTTSRLTLLG